MTAQAFGKTVKE